MLRWTIGRAEFVLGLRLERFELELAASMRFLDFFPKIPVRTKTGWETSAMGY